MEDSFLLRCLYLSSHPFKPLFLIISQRFSKYASISKYATIFKWQFSWTLTSLSSLADYLLVKLPCKVFFNISGTSLKFEILSDNNVLLNTQLQWRITNNFQDLYYCQDILQLVFTASFFANNNDLSLQISFFICLLDSAFKFTLYSGLLSSINGSYKAS